MNTPGLFRSTLYDLIVHCGDSEIAFYMFSWKKLFWSISQNSQEAPVPEYRFSKASGYSLAYY